MENKKKPPAWANVIGILGIIFGALGLLGATYELLMPMMFEMQEQMMTSMQEAAEKVEAERDKEAPCPGDQEQREQRASRAEHMAAMESMREIWERPPWHKTWSLINGSLAGLLGAGYLLASIFLLIMRPSAPTFFLAVAGASMLRNAVSFGVGIYAGSFLMFWSISSAATGFLIDLVLVIVVLVSDKSDYKA